MLSKFEIVLVPGKHSKILLIKVKFSLALIHALLGSFFLLARRSAICEKNGIIPCAFLQNTKTQVVSTIDVLLGGFADYIPVSLRFHSFYEQLQGCGLNSIWLII